MVDSGRFYMRQPGGDNAFNVDGTAVGAKYLLGGGRGNNALFEGSTVGRVIRGEVRVRRRRRDSQSAAEGIWQPRLGHGHSGSSICLSAKRPLGLRCHMLEVAGP